MNGHSVHNKRKILKITSIYYISIMSTAGENKLAISGLPIEEITELRKWFSETDWESLNAQIEADSDSGKLDFLLDEAHDEKSTGKLTDL
jgi:hypothetical protein